MQKYLLKKTSTPPISTPPISTPPISTPPISTPPISITDEENQYINSLTLKEKNAYEIAKTQLKTSFTLSKSQGYVEWTKK